VATLSAVPVTPIRGEHHVHFSPEHAGDTLHQALRQHHGYQSQSDSDDPFTVSGGNDTRVPSYTQVCSNS